METALQETLRAVVTDMIRTAAGAGPDGYRAELVQMLNAVFSLELTEDAVAAAPGSAALAQTVEDAWLESGGTPAELEVRLAVLADD